MIRVALPAHLRKLAHVDGEVKLDVAARSPSARCSMRSRRAIRCSAERSATTLRNAPAVCAVLRLRRGSLPRTTGRAAARCCCQGHSLL